MKVNPLHKSAIALSAVLIGVTLTGCSSSVTLACEPSGSGAQVESIDVSTVPLSKPKVSFPTPISAESIQSRVVVEGDGGVFTGRNLIEIEYAYYNAANGEVLRETNFDGKNPAPGLFGPDVLPNYCSALVGAKEGSRVVSLFPAMDAHGGRGIEELGIGSNDAVIFVIDITKVYLEKAQGSSVAPQAGMPAVVTTPDGIPGVTIPKTDAPEELRIAQLIKGSGETVKSGDKVTLHYSGFLWASETKFDSSWDKGEPAQFEFSPGNLIEGFLSAVVGQEVGSRVLVVIPPAFAYGQQASATIPANSTLVFVIDILGTSSK
jgi:peptidylprolyl isomerase